MNIRDIAKKSGVSIATVSRVLNGSPHVREATRQRILAVMEKEGYTPNAFARGLGHNSMRMVGILCTDVSDLYYARAVSLAEKQLRANGFGALLICTGGSLADKKQALSLLLEKGVDAILLIGSAFEEELDNAHLLAAAQRAPLVLINGLVEGPGIGCVLCDEQKAMEDCVAALAARGCTRILYLYDAMTSSGYRKLAGYRRGLQRAGIPVRCEQVVRTRKSLEDARRTVLSRLDGGKAADAVLASEDLLAAGAQKALAERGLSLPVIGCNNSPLAECASPALTSIDNALDLICPAAVNLLIEFLSGRTPPQKIVFPARLVERESFRLETKTPSV